MNDDLAGRFRRIADLVRSSQDPSSCWSHILETTGFESDPSLSSLAISSDLLSLTKQVQSVFDLEPIPAGVNFLWFGLFDLQKGSQELEGYYVSGWAGNDPDRGWQVYLPKSSYLVSEVLNGIKSRIRRELANEECATPKFELLDYALMLGAAALLTKFVIKALAIQLPVYVGFDSGDWALINEPGTSTFPVKTS